MRDRQGEQNRQLTDKEIRAKWLPITDGMDGRRIFVGEPGKPESLTAKLNRLLPPRARDLFD